MTSSEEALAKLNEWKDRSTKLFMNATISGVTCWCVGKVLHTASEIHFGIEGIDGKDFLFVVNTHYARFRFVDVREELPFSAPQRNRAQFGTTLEIDLRGDTPNENRGRVILAELFLKVLEM